MARHPAQRPISFTRTRRATLAWRLRGRTMHGILAASVVVALTVATVANWDQVSSFLPGNGPAAAQPTVTSTSAPRPTGVSYTERELSLAADALTAALTDADEALEASADAKLPDEQSSSLAQLREQCAAVLYTRKDFPGMRDCSTDLTGGAKALTAAAIEAVKAAQQPAPGPAPAPKPAPPAPAPAPKPAPPVPPAPAPPVTPATTSQRVDCTGNSTVTFTSNGHINVTGAGSGSGQGQVTVTGSGTFYATATASGGGGVSLNVAWSGNCS